MTDFWHIASMDDGIEREFFLSKRGALEAVAGRFVHEIRVTRIRSGLYAIRPIGVSRHFGPATARRSYYVGRADILAEEGFEKKSKPIVSAPEPDDFDPAYDLHGRRGSGFRVTS
jgi:hypothetical protein